MPSDLPGAVWALLAGMVIVLQGWLALSHEPFVDEWQAVQVAVQSPGWGQLFANLHYEGHPPLWYMLLRGLAVLVGPYNALPAAALLLGFVTQWLILFESPFPRWLRLMIALSAFILFEYNTVSRGYTLGVMLMVAAVAWWDRRRLVWLLIAALPFTDFLFGVVSLGFLLMRWRDKALWLPGLALWLAMSLLAAWTIVPAPDFASVYFASTRDLGMLMVWMARISVVALPLQGADLMTWDGPQPALASLTLWPLFLALAWVQTRGRRDMRIAMGGFLLATLLFCVLISPLANRHVMLAGVLLIVLTWRIVADGGRAGRGFSVWITVAALAGLFTAGLNFVRPFDTAQVAAARIVALGLRDEPWAAFPQQHGQGIAAMTGMRFGRLADTCEQDMVRWNQPYPFFTVPELEAGAVARAKRHGSFFLLTDSPLAPSAMIRPVAFVAKGIDAKTYRFYEIGPGLPRDRRKLPHCAPGTPPLTSDPLL